MKFILDENYPKIYPCVDCVYWRYIYGGNRYNGRPMTEDSLRVPACHYVIDNGELRGCPGGKGCTRFVRYVDK